MSIANEKRPSTFKEYIGQKGAVGYCTSVIKSGAHPNGLLISGVPGLGKTSLAHLYVKATLCETRKEGEYEPCGECDCCRADIEKGGHPNITYYRITEATTFKDAVGDLISMTKAVPQITHDDNRADNFRRFIIIDELQNASRQSISPFLDSLEFAHENVTVVLISMDLDKLDHIVRDAIESRCIELSLDKLSKDIISSKLQQEFPDLHPDSADMIAYLSKGNMRRAWSTLEYFKAQIPVLELTPEIIAEQKIGGLSTDKCLEIISSLENSTWDQTALLLTEVSNDEEQAVDFFLNTIVNEDLNSNGIELISSCSIWMQCDYKTPILALFRPFQGKNLTGVLEKEIAIPSLIQIESKPSVSTIYSSKIEVEQMRGNITNQLATITGKEIITSCIKWPPLAFTKWSHFLKYYADNN
jgi:DNA polymerase III gamma/tau subunit